MFSCRIRTRSLAKLAQRPLKDNGASVREGLCLRNWWLWLWAKSSATPLLRLSGFEGLLSFISWVSTSAPLWFCSAIFLCRLSFKNYNIRIWYKVIYKKFNLLVEVSSFILILIADSVPIFLSMPCLIFSSTEIKIKKKKV